MELSIYTATPKIADNVQNFINIYYATHMEYLASDLLEKGLTPLQINEAITKAIKVANESDIKTHKHFLPVYSALKGGIIKDCKLSQLGYGLVLMNADIRLHVVSEFQVDILKGFLKTC